MANENRKIINREGSPVTVFVYNGEPVSTKALIGRVSKQGSTAISIEAYRKCILAPEIAVDSGHYVSDGNDTFLTLSAMKEVVQGRHVTNYCQSVRCNAKMTVSGEVKIADDAGNIRKIPATKVNGMDVYIEWVNAELRQYTPGLFPDTEMLIHAPAVLTLDLLDRVVITANGQNVPLKLIAADFITFAGLVVIQAKSETRK